MPSDDAIRWDARYSGENRISDDVPRSLLTGYAGILPEHGLALDLAMGLGGNAGFLIQHGLHVVGVDISLVALQKAKSRLPALMAVAADLKQFYIPPGKFDVIINFLFLQRDLWLPMVQGLALGGVLFMECLTEEMLLIHPEISRDFLLKPGELEIGFISLKSENKLEIMYYYEGWQPTVTSHRRASASLIARRIR